MERKPKKMGIHMWLSQVELLSRVATEKSQLATELLPARAGAAVSPSPKSKGAWEGLHPARVRSDALSANAGAGVAHRESRDRLRWNLLRTWVAQRGAARAGRAGQAGRVHRVSQIEIGVSQNGQKRVFLETTACFELINSI